MYTVKKINFIEHNPTLQNSLEFSLCLFSLDKEQYYAGDNMRLRLDIESSSSYFKPKISSITFEVSAVKLFRK